MSVEQIMAAQSDIEANSYTLRSCVETVTAVSNLSRRLQNRTCEVHQLHAQLSLLQRMYKDARVEISALKKQNKELKRLTTSVTRFGVSSHNQFDSRRGIISFGNSAKAEAESSKASKEHIVLDDFYTLNGSDYQNGTRDDLHGMNNGNQKKAPKS
ncbi:unnamed protein product [Camellia sinensis]